MHGNGRLIESIRHITDPNEFFTSVAQTNSKVLLTTDGLFSINGQIDIHPRSFSELGGVTDPNRRTGLLTATADYSNGEMTEEQYRQTIKSFQQNERLAFVLTRDEIMTKAANGFGATDIQQVEIGGRKIFANISIAEVDRLGRVLSERQYNANIIKAASTVASERGCQNVNDFCSYLELVYHELQVYLLLKIYRLTHSHFQNKTKVERVEILDNLQNKNNSFFKTFNDTLNSDLQEAQRLRSTATYSFANDLFAVYHFRKHGHEFGHNTPMEIYLHDVPSNLFSNDHYLFSAGYSQNGRIVRIVYANPENQQIGFLIKTTDGSSRWVASTFIHPGFFGSAEQWQNRVQNALINLNNRSFQANSQTCCGGIDFSYLLGQQQYAKENLDLFMDMCRTAAAFFII